MFVFYITLRRLFKSTVQLLSILKFAKVDTLSCCGSHRISNVGIEVNSFIGEFSSWSVLKLLLGIGCVICCRKTQPMQNTFQ